LCFRALKSICTQRFDGIEVVLVDDCSTDLMPEYFVEILELEKILYVKHKVNKGLAVARNSAIKAASGKYFSFCDDDDQWPEGLAARLFEAARSGSTEVDMAVVLPSFYQKKYQYLLNNYPRLKELIRLGVTPPVGSQLYKTETIRKVGGYNKKIRSGVDHDLWISLSKLNPRVAVVFGGQAISGSDLVRERMTMNEEIRRSGIEESLKIWEPQIIEIFGQEFYRHFNFSYKRYLDYSFFKKSLRSGRYFNATIRALSPNVFNVLIEQIMHKISGTPFCNSFPEFKNIRKR